MIYVYGSADTLTNQLNLPIMTGKQPSAVIGTIGRMAGKLNPSVPFERQMSN